MAADTSLRGCLVQHSAQLLLPAAGMRGSVSYLMVLEIDELSFVHMHTCS